MLVLLIGVVYAGSQIYITNKNQRAQVSGSGISITNGQLITTSVAQGGTITFKLYLAKGHLTADQVSKLYIEPLGPNKPIMTITQSGVDTYTAQIPSDFPVGKYDISVFPKLNTGMNDVSWYFNEQITITKATPVTPPIVPPVVTPPVVVVPPVNPPVVITPPVVNQGFSATPPPVVSASSNGLGIDNIRLSESENSINITWNTSKLTHGFVDYGTTASYGKTEKTQTHNFINRTNSHIIRLYDLLPNTTYHFRIRVEAEGGVKATTLDGTFYSGPTPGWMNITSPNRNVVLQNNKTEKIFWHTGYKTLPIDIYLMGGKLSAPVKLKSSNAGHASFGVNVPQRNGQETITIPSTIIAPPGWGYYISIKINNTEVAKSESFEIAQNKGPVVFTVPTKTFKIGEPYTVTRNRDDALFSADAFITLEGGDLLGSGIDYSSSESRSEINPVIKTTIKVKKGVPPGKYKLKLKELHSFGVPGYSTIADHDVVVTN